MNLEDAIKEASRVTVQQPPGSGIIVSVNGNNMLVEVATFTLLAEMVARLDRVVVLLEQMNRETWTAG